MNHIEMGKLIAEGYGCKAFRLPVARPARFSSGRYAQRLGVSLAVIQGLGGRSRMRAMPPSARKIILRSMFVDARKYSGDTLMLNKLKDEATSRKSALEAK